jgi:hypothetical protein
MRAKLNYFAPLLAAVTSAAAIAVAPIATAAPSQGAAGAGAAASSNSGQQSCVGMGGTQSQCQSPGNAQIYDAPPRVDYFPYAGGGT